MPRQIITKILKVNPSFPQLEKIKLAADSLRRGAIIAFPTETVYGLGVNLANEKAVRRLYEVKQRLGHKPITVHIGSAEKIKELATQIPDFTFKLTKQFWPGPLTLILSGKQNGKTIGASASLSANGEPLDSARGSPRGSELAELRSRTIGFRFPKHPVALGIINESRSIVGATSANISQTQAAKSPAEVLTQFNGLIDIIVDGGIVEGIESTILDLTCFPPKIIREGKMANEVKESLSEILKLRTKTILLVCTGNSCRSPMAKGYLTSLLKDRGDIEVISAGVAAMSGMYATHEAVKVMADAGVDISGHFARNLTDEMIKKADLILVMEKQHQEKILQRAPQAKGKVYLLKEFGQDNNSSQQEDLDIPDPIGKPLEFYQKCFTIIKEEIERIVRLL